MRGSGRGFRFRKNCHVTEWVPRPGQHPAAEAQSWDTGQPTGSAGSQQLRDKGVWETGSVGCVLEHKGVRCWEVERESDACHIGAAGHIHCDAIAAVKVGAAEKGGVEQPISGSIELRYEGVAADAAVSL